MSTNYHSYFSQVSDFRSIVLNSLNSGVVADVKITNNEITSGSLGVPLSTGTCLHISNSTNAQSGTNTPIQHNYLHKCAWRIEIDGNTSASNTTILKNTIDNTKSSGISINSGEHNHPIQENIISNSLGAGLVIEGGALGIKNTKNSIYQNNTIYGVAKFRYEKLERRWGIEKCGLGVFREVLPWGNPKTALAPSRAPFQDRERIIALILQI
jgi:hypothetical protein